jgi:hypothetical protein
MRAAPKATAGSPQPPEPATALLVSRLDYAIAIIRARFAHLLPQLPGRQAKAKNFIPFQQ